MKNRKTLLRAGVATTALSLAALAAAPASAALHETDYGIRGSSYATRVKGGMVPVESERTAYSYLPCTRLTGLHRGNAGAVIGVPADSPMVTVDGAKTTNTSFRNKKKKIVAGSRSTSTIAAIKLGDGNQTPALSIKGLKATSEAWVTKNGKFHTDNDVTSVKLGLQIPDSVPIPPELAGPLNMLIDSLNGGISQVITTILSQSGLGQGEGIVIPGLGRLSVGFEKERHEGSKTAKFATAAAFVLKIKLFGPDMTEGNGTDSASNDDILVGIGRTRAKITRNVPAAVMSGKAYAVEGSLLGGIAGVGKIALQPLPCQGTDGKVKERNTVGLNLQDQLAVGALHSEVMGKQYKDGRAKAYTESKVAELTLGPATLSGIVAHAGVRQNKFGKIVSRSTKGTGVGTFTMDGQSQGLDCATLPPEAKTIEIPQLATITLCKKTKLKRGVEMTAVSIELLNGTPGESTINLGNARVRLDRN